MTTKVIASSLTIPFIMYIEPVKKKQLHSISPNIYLLKCNLF